MPRLILLVGNIELINSVAVGRGSCQVCEFIIGQNDFKLAHKKTPQGTGFLFTRLLKDYIPLAQYRSFIY
jgi:hypothetical protein